MSVNKLNELSAQEWLKFTKSWFIYNPPPRKGQEKLHPAKFPEGLVKEFICFFTKKNQLVFDPFLGTGSTLVACSQCQRKGVGIELQEKYAEIARKRVFNDHDQKVICDNSFNLKQIWKKNHFPQIDFLITSPPYGPMLNKKGLVQNKRKKQGLDTNYSTDQNDLGNVADYSLFVQKLVKFFIEAKPLIKEGAYLVIILQNYRNGPEFKTLAWDVAGELKKEFTLAGCRIWCQDNKTLYPYGYRYSFVPNIHHHYCLIFRR